MEQRVLFVIKNLYTMERLGVMQMSAFARQKGWETDLIISDELGYGDILSHVRSFDPSILAFSAMSPEYPALETIARQLKTDTDCFIIFGGPHPTFFQDIIKQRFVDAVSFGEGDISFPAFLEKYSAGEDYTKIPGMHFHIGGKIVRNPPALLVDQLDALLFADRDLMVKGNSLLQHNRSHIFMASRGCPNACTYCFNHKYNQLFRSCGKMIRRRSVENLILEMEAVRRQLGTEFAYIDDDIFTLCSLDWLEEFAEKYPERIGLPFMCNVHVNYINEDKIRLLKKAGCRYVCFGIECGDTDVSKKILKRNIANQDIIKLGRLLREYGIRFMTQNLMALPVDDPLDVDLKTLDLNILCKPHYAVAHLFYPLPGTELTQYASDNDFFDADSAQMPERTNSYSALNFPDRKKKILVQRLHKLFGLTVSFPFIRPLLPVLIRLPLGAVYSVFFVLWYGFSMRFRLERTKKSIGEVLFFLKSLGRSFSSFVKRPKKQGESS